MLYRNGDPTQAEFVSADDDDGNVTYDMGSESIDEMFYHVIHLPAVHAEARRFMWPDDFSDYEQHYAALATALFHLVDKGKHPAGEIPCEALRAQVEKVLKYNNDPKVLDRGRRYVIGYGGPPDSLAIFKGEDPLLDRAYRRKASQLRVEDGLEILKRFLMERQVKGASRGWARNRASLLQIQERAAEIEAIGRPAAVRMKGGMPELLAWLEAGCGKPLIGLATGLADLDERTLGLRGLTVLGAMPNSGKTAMAVSIAVGVARDAANGGAAAVFLSLDMGKVDIQTRILSHVSGLDWATLRRGSPKCRDRPDGPYYDVTDSAKLEAAKVELTGALGDRLTVLGRKDLPGDLDAARLVTLLDEAKIEVRATRGLLIVDYIQLIDVPAAVAKQGDLAADKYRIAVMQRVVDLTRSAANPEGDAVLAISEVRKPPDAKQDWGAQLSDITGAARTTYLADALLLYSRMTAAEVKRTYGLGAASKDLVAQHLAQLDEEGVTPMIVSLAKGRDGMRRGKWPMEFAYRISTWRQPPVCLPPPATGGMLAGAADDDDDEDDEDDLDGPPAWQPAQNGDASPNGHLADPDGDAGPQVARERLLAALAAFPDGETATALAQAAKLAAGPAREVLEGLVAEGRVVAAVVAKPHGKGGKGVKTHPGYRLAGVNGQPEGASPTMTPTTAAMTPTTITPTTAKITPTKAGTPATYQG